MNPIKFTLVALTLTLISCNYNLFTCSQAIAAPTASPTPVNNCSKEGLKKLYDSYIALRNSRYLWVKEYSKAMDEVFKLKDKFDKETDLDKKYLLCIQIGGKLGLAGTAIQLVVEKAEKELEILKQILACKLDEKTTKAYTDTKDKLEESLTKYKKTLNENKALLKDNLNKCLECNKKLPENSPNKIKIPNTKLQPSDDSFSDSFDELERGDFYVENNDSTETLEMYSDIDIEELLKEAIEFETSIESEDQLPEPELDEDETDLILDNTLDNTNNSVGNNFLNNINTLNSREQQLEQELEQCKQQLIEQQQTIEKSDFAF